MEMEILTFSLGRKYFYFPFEDLNKVACKALSKLLRKVSFLTPVMEFCPPYLLETQLLPEAVHSFPAALTRNIHTETVLITMLLGQ